MGALTRQAGLAVLCPVGQGGAGRLLTRAALMEFTLTCKLNLHVAACKLGWSGENWKQGDTF